MATTSRVARVAPLLFGSGTCALVYQTVWLRELRLVFGASTAASAAVLAIFMGGLGLGSAVLGKKADARRDPLAFYSNLELAIALSAAATPFLVTLARSVYLSVGGTPVLGMFGGTIARLVLSAIVLGVPTFLMGGTLPAAARAVETASDAGRRNLALLYGTNTLGAVTGAALPTFVLLELFGNRRTLWLACASNVLVAIAARSIARRLPSGDAGEEGTATGESAAPWLVLVSAGLVGFAFLLMELVWYRMLGPVLGGSSYTFGLILAVALLGVGIGGALYALTAAGRASALAFAATCALEAAAIALPYALGDRVAVFALLLRPLGAFGFYGHVVGWTLVTSLVVLPAAVVAGFQFPLLIGLLGQGRKDVGRHVGFAYAWNTVGAIVGSLAGGFGLLPLFTAPGTWRLVAALLLALSLLWLAVARDRRPLPIACVAAAAIAIVVMLGATGPTAAWRHSPIGAGRADQDSPTRNSIAAWIRSQRRSIAWEVDGVESSVALSASGGYAFVLNGKVDGHARGDASTQVMSGLAGALLHPEPARALVVGLGTGSTAGWLGKVATMQRVDAVELEPAMVEISRACTPVNEDVLANPRVHVVIGDAREYLLATRDRYDLIFAEPSNPYRAGIASLFTREFYASARERLNDGGIFLQFVQAYEIETDTARTIFSTLTSVFGNVETWATNGHDMLLVATVRPIPYDAGALRKRAAEEPFRSALAKTWRVRGLEGFLAHRLAGPSLATALAGSGDGALNTDDLPLVEFAFARSVGTSARVNLADLWQAARRMSADRPQATGEVDWAAVDEQRLSMFAIDGLVNGAPPGLPEASDARIRSLLAALHGDAGAALAAVPLLDPSAGDLDELALWSDAAAEAGTDASAQIDALAAVDAVEADVLRARQALRRGDAATATARMEAALVAYRDDPWPLVLVMERALSLVPEIAAADPSGAARLYAALEKPFSVHMFDDSRKKSLMQVAEVLEPTPGPRTQAALHQVEPHVPWERSFLTAPRPLLPRPRRPSPLAPQGTCRSCSPTHRRRCRRCWPPARPAHEAAAAPAAKRRGRDTYL
ncbi:MAG: fused MFS/spermidine synthase [Acidobacteriota bacterium]